MTDGAASHPFGRDLPRFSEADSFRADEVGRPTATRGRPDLARDHDVLDANLAGNEARYGGERDVAASPPELRPPDEGGR